MPTIQSKYRGSKEYLLIYAELIAAARHRGLVTYQEIAQIMGLPLSGNHMSREVGYILGEISDDEREHGRPMLSAIVVGVSGKPGAGLFALAKQFDRFDDEDEVARERFVHQERQAVYDTWKTNLKQPG
jgi:hypothetical protein